MASKEDQGSARSVPRASSNGRTEAAPSAAFTPGPWAWMGGPHGLYLATTHSGRRYVLGFRRMGMSAAQPVFQINSRMVPADQLVEFEVGDGTARGFAAGKADASVYRYDVIGIDAPDARLIAAAPDLYEALKLAEDRHQRGMANMTAEELQRVTDARRAALAKAEGRS